MKKIYLSLRAKVLMTLLGVFISLSSFSQTDVLVCGACSPQSWLDDVTNKLIGTGSFNSVTSYNTYLTGTPTLAYLQGFDAVLVFTDYGPLDPTTLGNNLAQYIDGGGAVVSCVFTNASVPLGGNFNTATYQVCIPAGGQFSTPQLTLGSVLDPCSPIMNGITSFDGGSNSYRSNSSNFVAGSTTVANWSNGEWLVATRTNVGPLNVRRCDLNFYPPSSDVRSDFWQSSTQGAQLMANALLWTAGVTNNNNPPAAPASVSGTNVFCEGGTSSFTAASVAGATGYTWTVPSGMTITSGQGTITINVSTSAAFTNTVSVVATNACGSSAPTTYTVTVNPMPTISYSATPSAAICIGNSVTLNGSGAVSYSWTGGVMDGVPFSPTLSDSYTVTGTDANGCTNTAIAGITVNALPTVGATSTAAAVCDGDQVTLNGTGASSYTWSHSLTDGVAFTPAGTDTYTVTGTDANGCSNTGTIMVTVNALPSVGSNPPSASVCPGGSVTLSGTGASTYTWMPMITDTVPFQPAMSDTYTVTGTDTNGCSNTATVSVTVYSSPTITASATDTLVCPNDMVTFNGGGGVSYTWSGGVTDNVPFAIASPDTFTVTGTDANGCTNTATISVNTHALPAVSYTQTPSTAVCEGSSVTLAGTGAVSYTWTGGVNDNVPFVAMSTATYTVTGTDSNGCMNTSEAIVTVNPLPVVTGSAPSTMCEDDASATLVGTPSGGTWSGPGVVATFFSAQTAGVGTHQLIYTYTDANGCTNADTVSVQVNACVGIVENAQNNNYSVYPNPNNGTFTLAINSNAGDVAIEMVDLSGRVVYSSNVNNVQAGFTTQIATENLAAGTYMLRVISANDQQVIRVNVQ